MKKIFAMLLVLAMAFTMVSAVAENNDEHMLIYGTSTEIGGDFAPGAWWTNNATDKMIRDLSNDCSTVVSNQGGEYIINPTVCESITSVMNDDGTKTFTVKVKSGLKYNSGKEITIQDFVWTTLFACSKMATDVGAKLSGYLTIVGGQDYYDGKADTVTGLRILDENTLSVTIVADKVPYFYDITYAGFSAFDIAYWLGEGYGVADDGNGCYFTGEPTAESIKDRLEYARFNAGPDRVSAGPYNLVEFDKAALQATFEINPNYAGNFEGQKPSIKKFVIVKAESATWNDAIKTGAFNFYDTITDGDEINQAMDIVEAGGFNYVQFDRPGYGKIMFQCDFGPTQFKAVRHAVAMLLDRNEFANTFCQGWGGVVNGPYGTGLWQYQEAEEWLDENLNPYTYNYDNAVAALVEDGWTLNEKGEAWTEGIRYKKVTEKEAGDYAHNVTLADGTILMPLIIEWSSSDGNPVSELLKVMLSENPDTAKAGMQINQNVMTFSELLNYMYRDTSVDAKYGLKTYGMYNLASNFQPAYDQSYSFTLDPDLLAQGYNQNYLLDEELDKLSMDMVYTVNSDETEKYMDMWKQFIARWNDLLPEIPLYSNIYITLYPEWLENYEQDSFWDFSQAILYATIAE